MTSKKSLVFHQDQGSMPRSSVVIQPNPVAMSHGPKPRRIVSGFFRFQHPELHFEPWGVAVYKRLIYSESSRLPGSRMVR